MKTLKQIILLAILAFISLFTKGAALVTPLTTIDTVSALLTRTPTRGESLVVMGQTLPFDTSPRIAKNYPAGSYTIDGVANFAATDGSIWHLVWFTAGTIDTNLYQAGSITLSNLTANPSLYQATNSALTTLATGNGASLTNLQPASAALSNLTANPSLYQATNSTLTLLSGNNGSSLTSTGATNENQLVTLAQLEAAVPGNQIFFFTTNAAVGFAPGGTVKSTNWTSTVVPPQGTNIAATVVTGDYAAKYISTNSFAAVASGLLEVEIYAFESAAGSGQLAAEAYVVNSVTGIEEYEFGSGSLPQTVAASTTPTILTFSVPITDYASTTNFYIAVKLKATVTGGANFTPRIVVGGVYDSHMAFSIPGSSYVLKSGDTMTGALTVATINGGTSVSGGTNTLAVLGGTATNNNSIAIGPNSSTASYTNAVAMMGAAALANNHFTIGTAGTAYLGANTYAGANTTVFKQTQAVVLGGNVGSGLRGGAWIGSAISNDCFAFGFQATTATFTNAWAIGRDATNTTSSQIMLGSLYDSVVAPNILTLGGQPMAAWPTAANSVQWTNLVDGPSIRWTVTGGRATAQDVELIDSVTSVTNMNFLSSTTISNTVTLGTNLTMTAVFPQITYFTNAGSFTWTNPPGCRLIEIHMWGGAGGGGSGRRGLTNTVRTGGGGGAGGNYAFGTFDPTLLGNSPVTVVVGAGGRGGTNQTAASSNGETGVAGGFSAFGSGTLQVAASAGNGGVGGSTSAGGAGTAGTVYYTVQAAAGAASSGTGAAGTAGNNVAQPTMAGGGGASGGGNTVANAGGAGAAGGSGSRSFGSSGDPGSAGAANGGNGGDAVGRVKQIVGGSGGGSGGGGGNSAAGGNGGAGAFPAGGGGGGGAGTDAVGVTGGNGGAGGAGANGCVIVIAR